MEGRARGVRGTAAVPRGRGRNAERERKGGPGKQEATPAQSGSSALGLAKQKLGKTESRLCFDGHSAPCRPQGGEGPLAFSFGAACWSVVE